MNQITQSFALVAALTASASAIAQDDIHPSLNSKYWVEVGGYYPTHSVSLGVEGGREIIDSQIEFEGAVNLSDRKGLWVGEMGWQFGENWAVNAQYFETDRSRNFVLQEEIEWDDLIFDVGVDITAGTDASVMRPYFSRKMLEQDRHDLRLGVGIRRMSIGVNYQRLSVNGQVEKDDWRGDLDIELIQHRC